jgi:hypothetical protein
MRRKNGKSTLKIVLSKRSPSEQAKFRKGLADVAKYPWTPAIVGTQPVEVCFGEAEDGRLVVTGLFLDPRPNREVSTAALRSISPTQLALAGSPLRWLWGYVFRSQQSKGAKAVRPGRRPLEMEELRRFAEKYEGIRRRYPGRNPVKQLVTDGVPQSTVYRKLQRCRDLGLLGTEQLQERKRRSRR